MTILTHFTPSRFLKWWTIIAISLLTTGCETRLVFVQVICRHGDRSPEWVPEHEINRWAVKPGHLTQRGMLQALQVGEFLRERYITGPEQPLLAPEYDPVEARFFATSTDRTRQTALVAGSAMYEQEPPGDGLHFYPVPYTTHEFDIGVNWTQVCPVYGKFLTTEFANSTNFTHEFDHKHHEALELVKKKFNTSVSFVSVYRVYDLLLIEQIHGLTRPWVNSTLVSILKELAQASLNHLVSKDQKSALRFAQGFQSIFRNLRMKIEGSLQSKFLFYAAHDVTLHGWLYWLGKPFNGLLGYVSFLLIELHSTGEDGKYGVKILMYPGTHLQLVDVSLRDLTHDICQSEMCSMEKLEYLLDDLLSLDYKSACNGCIQGKRFLLWTYIISAVTWLFVLLRI